MLELGQIFDIGVYDIFHNEARSCPLYLEFSIGAARLLS